MVIMRTRMDAPTPPSLPVTLVRFDAPALHRVLDLFGQAEGMEPCGLLLGRRERGGTRARVVDAVSVANSHPTPHERWSMDPEAQLEATRLGRGDGLEILGTWHGHLLSPPEPSRADWEGHLEFERAAAHPQVCVIAGRGSGAFAVVRAWMTADDGLREVPIRN